MAEIAVNFLLERLANFLVKEAQLLGGVRQEIEGIKEELESIQGFLKDADRKTDSSEGIKTWVRQVRRVAYDVEDLIDEFVLRCGRRHGGDNGNINCLDALFSSMKQLRATYRLAKNIQANQRKIAKISERRGKYDIQKTEEDNTLDATIRRFQDYGGANIVAEPEVVGIEKDVDLLVEELVGATGKYPKTCYKFISVVGMGGLGKTTLVRKVYKEPKVKAHFDCSAWVSVSQSFNAKDLLKNMLTEFCKTNKSNVPDEVEDIEKMDADKLRTEVQKHLQAKKFLLVLDDVWESGAWVLISYALPMNPNGSKIMITTRIKSVAVEVGATGKENFIHELKTLPEDAAKVLLSLKVFGRNAMPLEFEEVCKVMLQRCGGLPLEIVILGGILRNKKTVLEWEKVNHNLAWQLGHQSTSGRSIGNILKLSYIELPFHLKPCFLYCGLFPEDHLIKRNKLIRLWVAEGFIEERSESTMEEVGEEYLMQLIDRSILETAEASVDGRVKSCRIHDLMRDLAVSISQEEEFLFKLEKQVRARNVIKPRRMSVIGEKEENEISSTAGNQHLRSLLFFGVGYMSTCNLISYSAKLTLLRVLDLHRSAITELPTQIALLLHLRYLGLNGNWKLNELPRSIGRLQNLETLDIRKTDILALPEEITRLKNLRHLCMGDKWIMPTVEVPKGICNLRCLQTLIGARCPAEGIAAEIENLQLKRLDIGYYEELGIEEVYKLCTAISGMRHLFRLKVSVQHQVQSHGRFRNLSFGKAVLEDPPPHLRMLDLEGLTAFPFTLGSFNNLIRLTLKDGSFREDPFPSLSSLPSLAVLHLLDLKNIKSLQCGCSGFSRLKELKLEYMLNLEEVIFEEGSMVSLKQLRIEYCETLKMVPQGIQHIKLGELVLEGISDDFEKRLEEGGEDRCKVEHIPLVTVVDRIGLRHYLVC